MKIAPAKTGLSSSPLQPRVLPFWMRKLAARFSIAPVFNSALKLA